MTEPTRPIAATTGLPHLDAVFHGVMPGDNIVWKVSDIGDYRKLVRPYAEAARRLGAHLVYFRFADHEPLLPDSLCSEIIPADPGMGFDAFDELIQSVIDRAGDGAWYVFDNLSHLAERWRSDQLMGNFFMRTCPHLFDLHTVTYFAVLRNRHTLYAMRAVTETTQWMLEVFRHRGRHFIRPVKVQHRSTQAMNLIHEWKEGDRFEPVRDSATVSELLADAEWPGLQADSRLGYWRRFFNLARSQADGPRRPELFRQALSMLIGDEPPLPEMAGRYLSLEDLLAIRDRQIGIGRIGGKAAGMLLARAVLRAETPELAERLEAHDSFYVGSEVHQTFLVQNRLFGDRLARRREATFLDGIAEARERILAGKFPDYTLEQFEGMLDYFGEWPFIVRSSSLLEDAYGNAFAGKYESVFCANRGPREERLAALLDAVREVYASTVSEEALRYRHRRGLLAREEQMALLIMRVSGSEHASYFYPQAAGVGLSFNPYPWDRRIDPKAGVLRLVFGLGTRAVDRSDDDYTRLVALNEPSLRPESSFEEIFQASQRRADVLDVSRRRIVPLHFLDVLEASPGLPASLYVSQRRSGDGAPMQALTFDGLLGGTPFVADMRAMLDALHKAYAHPVEIEFALNVLRDGTYRINLLQCRTLQVRHGEQERFAPPDPGVRRLAEARGAVIGLSRRVRLDALVWVEPEAFTALSMARRHEVAGVVGRAARACADAGQVVGLLGPGRWGTRDPALGVPVHFSDIARVAALGEIAAMHSGLAPDASLGTHFLNELVEMDILYFALFPGREGNRLDLDALRSLPNHLADRVPSAGDLASVVRVAEPPAGGAFVLYADASEQSVALCAG